MLSLFFTYNLGQELYRNNIKVDKAREDLGDDIFKMPGKNRREAGAIK